MSELPAILRVFSCLSLLTVGGGMAAFPEIKALTVDTHKWLNFDQMVHPYSVGQLSPGPNMRMIVPFAPVSMLMMSGSVSPSFEIPTV